MRNLIPRSVNRYAIASTLAAFLATMSGCSTRVILVPNGEPVRLAEPVRARIFVTDSSGHSVLSQNRVTIPAGWYALPK